MKFTAKTDKIYRFYLRQLYVASASYKLFQIYTRPIHQQIPLILKDRDFALSN